SSPAPTLPRGMRFKDSKSAFYAVQDYALYHNKQVKVARRGGKHRKMTDHTWYVSSADLTHSAECTSTAKPTQRQLVESSSFQQALAAAPNGTASQLLQQLKGRTNLRTIYRAKQIMKKEHLTQVGSKVPGAFSRAFVSCNVFTQSTTFNQQIYGFEARPCNNSEASYQGVHFDNYRWFFRCVEDSGVSLRYCPVLCAIDTELLSLESELGLTFRYCTRYIIEHDLTRMGSFSRHHHALVWGLQGSETEAEYNNRLEWIGTTRTFYETAEQEQFAASGAGNGSGAQDLYNAECKRIGEYKVSQASETVAFTNTCSCAFIDQYAIPCRHLIAVLLFCEKMDTV
ncbi:hypothetical protein PHYSODRAFT_454697, partial [Phytophthora sojae]